MEKTIGTIPMDRQAETRITFSRPQSSSAEWQAVQPEKTRVLLLTNSILMGGMEEHVEMLARHLDRRQFEVFAICPDWPDVAQFRDALMMNADHVAAITTDRRDGYGIWRQMVQAVRAYRQIRAWRIEVMHIHARTFAGQLSILAVARLAGVNKVFVTEHLAPDTPLAPRARLLRNLFSWMVDGIVCVSKKNLEQRRSFIYTPLDRAVVVNNGVDLQDFSPIDGRMLTELRRRHNIPEEACIVGTAVRFGADKGLQYLLDALPAIKAACPNALLLMVGDGPLRAELEAHVDRLGLSESVRFVGFQLDPRPYVAMMDAFVLPVPVGSMSIALLEAMALERACVITFGGDGEAIIHGESGFCAEPRNPQSIAHYVIQILHDSSLKQALGAAARRRVESEFSAQQVALSLGILYTRAA